MDDEQPISGRTGSGVPDRGMTQATLAVTAPEGRRVLRVALVLDGRVVDERLVKDRGDVTIGSDEGCTLVTSRGNVGPRRRVLEAVRGGYRLCFDDAAIGRVACSRGVLDLCDLRTSAKRTGGGWSLRLADDARGKIVLGEVTVLFQLVPAPPPRAKPQLPLGVMTPLAGHVDWAFTIIAAMSFLFHFGAVGALYADWADRVVDDDVRVDFRELARVLAPDLRVETPPDPSNAPTAEATKSSPAPRPGPVHEPKAGPPRGPAEPRGNGQLALVGQLAQMQLEKLGSLGAAGPAVGDVFRGGAAPSSILDFIASTDVGVGGSTRGLNLAVSGGPIIADGGRSLGNVGETTRGTPGGAGSAPPVAGPKPVIDAAPPTVVGGSISDADRVVNRLRGAFRQCYARGIDRDPTMEGSVRLTAKVGPNGDVLSAAAGGGSGLSSDVVACLVGRLRGAHFEAPSSDLGATIVVPVSFRLQK